MRKKMTKLWQQEVRKEEAKAKQAKEAEEARLKKAEEAKKIVINLDTSLPEPIKIKIDKCKDHRGQRIQLFCWQEFGDGRGWRPPRWGWRRGPQPLKREVVFVYRRRPPDVRPLGPLCPRNAASPG